jgi:hypothetical protein
MKTSFCFAAFAALLTSSLTAQSDANLLWTSNGANSHDAVGHKLYDTYDLNADGARDFYSINAWADTNGLNNNGLIQARSGLDGSVIWSHAGTQNGIALGRHLRRPADINGDGIHDLFLVSFDTSSNGLIENGFVRALNGANGNVLWQRDGTSDYEWYGFRNSLMEDINGDGVGDLMIASPEASTNGFSANGYVAAIDSTDGSTIWRTDGAATGERVGNGFLYARHLDNNGVRDIVVSNSIADTNGLFHNGYVMAVSGSDGSIMWRLDGTGNNRQLGQKLHGINDLDNDGFKDLVITDPIGSTGVLFENGAVTAISGATGLSIWQASGSNFLQQFGASVEFSPDLNGDSVDDLFLGSPDDSVGGLTLSGSVQAIDGSNGATLWTRAGTIAGDRFGVGLHLVGDVTGDGFSDIMTVNESASVGGHIENGSVAMISAATGTIVWRREGATSGFQMGHTVGLPIEESARDMNGDGTPDVILGTPFVDFGVFVNNGEIAVLDGASGATLWSVNGSANDERLGDILDVNDDLDGDGIVDLLSASRYSDTAGYTNNGSVHAFSGAAGTHLWKHSGGNHDEDLGNDRGTIVAFDVDGDGRPEVLAGTPLANVGGLVDNGYIVCISAGMDLVLECTPLIAGQSTTLSLDGLQPGATTIFAASVSGPAHTVIGASSSWVGMANPHRMYTGPASATGTLSFTTAVPAGLSGFTARLQAVSTPGSAIEVSRMLVREIQ